MPQNIIEQYGIQLRPLASEDIEQVRIWRNHPDVSRFMVNQDVISPLEQEKWFSRISTSNKSAYYVAVFRENAFGLAYIHSLDDCSVSMSRRIEPGMYLAPETPYRGTVLAFCPALALNDHCFEVLHCEKLIAKVKRDNRAALRFNERLGYQTFGEKDGYCRQELLYGAYTSARDKLKQIIRF